MKIAHLVLGTGWGGAERMACIIARGGQERGDAIAIDVSPGAEAGSEADGLSRLAPPLDRRKTSRRNHRGQPAVVTGEGRLAAGTIARAQQLWRWAHAARARLASFEPEIVHLHLATPALAAVAAYAASGRPTVWTMHLLPEQSWPLDFATRLPSAWSVRAGTRRDATLVAVSRSDEAQLRARFRECAVRAVLNVPPRPLVEECPLDRMAWGDATFALLLVGRLDPQKGVDRILRALAGLPSSFGSFRLLIVGDGSERTRLEGLARELGLAERVIFGGARPAGSAIAAADLVVCPSRYEGMPLVPMEAILAGTPVIASPIGPHRELLQHVPEALFPADESAWSSWLAALLSRPHGLVELAKAESELTASLSLDTLHAGYAEVYRERLELAR